MTGDDFARELRRSEQAFQRAYGRTNTLREHRNRLVREAIAAGWSHAQVARATGMSRARVGQLAAANGNQPEGSGR